jgi:nitroreductase
MTAESPFRPDNETFRTIVERHSVRRFAERPVPDDLIRHGRDLFQLDEETNRDFFRTMEIQSSAAAVENLMLAATSLGLGTVWLGILYLIKDETLRLLGEPGGEFMAVIPVGYPEAEGAGPKKRPLAAVVKTLE